MTTQVTNKTPKHVLAAAALIALLVVGFVAFMSRGTDSIAATGKIISVSKVAGGEVVCVRDNANQGIPVCGVSPTAGSHDPGVPVGKCADIRVTSNSFHLKIRDC